MLNKVKLAIVVVACSINYQVHAEWDTMIKGVTEFATTNGGAELATSALSNSDAVSGLKEVLANGVESAVTTLGQSGGFLGNKAVEIVAPDSLKTIVATARTLGQGQYIDSFETTMNQAAEKAVPEAATILADAIREMSVDDAMNILNGSGDAATQYFRKVSEARLVEKFKPIVNQATAQTGVTAAYKNLVDLSSTPILGGILGANNTLDLDQYVTDRSLDGLFKYIAIEEKNIRSNPMARTSDLLKRVFGE